VDTVNTVHSTQLENGVLDAAYNALQTYHTRFQSRLGAANLVYVRQLLVVLRALLRLLNECKQSKVLKYLIIVSGSNVNLVGI